MKKQTAGGVDIGAGLMLLPLSLGGKNGGGVMHYALINAEDYPLIAEYKWAAQYNPCIRNFYAVTHVGSRKQRRVLQLHRVLLGLPCERQGSVGRPKGDIDEGDHVNRKTLDNRRSNLRVVKHVQNMNNRNYVTHTDETRAKISAKLRLVGARKRARRLTDYLDDLTMRYAVEAAE